MSKTQVARIKEYSRDEPLRDATELEELIEAEHFALYEDEDRIY